jgi:cysteine desulfuration protein SufE
MNVSIRTQLPAIETITENFSLLEDWDDRYRYVIELGRMLPPMQDCERTVANKVPGCVSKVWLATTLRHHAAGRSLVFSGDSDALIVRGLVAIVLSMLSGRSPEQILAADPVALFEHLGLREHLTPQRSNGFRSMVGRIRNDAQTALAALA